MQPVSKDEKTCVAAQQGEFSIDHMVSQFLNALAFAGKKNYEGPYMFHNLRKVGAYMLKT